MPHFNPAHTGEAYLRFIPRTEMDIAVVGAGICLTLDAKGVCTAARVSLGAVAAYFAAQRALPDFVDQMVRFNVAYAGHVPWKQRLDTLFEGFGILMPKGESLAVAGAWLMRVTVRRAVQQALTSQRSH